MSFISKELSDFLSDCIQYGGEEVGEDDDKVNTEEQHLEKEGISAKETKEEEEDDICSLIISNANANDDCSEVQQKILNIKTDCDPCARICKAATSVIVTASVENKGCGDDINVKEDLGENINYGGKIYVFSVLIQNQFFSSSVKHM